jgi:hypothetical protein
MSRSSLVVAQSLYRLCRIRLGSAAASWRAELMAGIPSAPASIKDETVTGRA